MALTRGIASTSSIVHDRPPEGSLEVPFTLVPVLKVSINCKGKLQALEEYSFGKPRQNIGGRKKRGAGGQQGSSYRRGERRGLLAWTWWSGGFEGAATWGCGAQEPSTKGKAGCA